MESDGHVLFLLGVVVPSFPESPIESVKTLADVILQVFQYNWLSLSNCLSFVGKKRERNSKKKRVALFTVEQWQLPF